MFTKSIKDEQRPRQPAAGQGLRNELFGPHGVGAHGDPGNGPSGVTIGMRGSFRYRSPAASPRLTDEEPITHSHRTVSRAPHGAGTGDAVAMRRPEPHESCPRSGR